MRPKSRPVSVSQNRISVVGPEAGRLLAVQARLAAWAVVRDIRVDSTRLTTSQSDSIANAALAAGLDKLAAWEAQRAAARGRRWDWRRWPWTRRDR